MVFQLIYAFDCSLYDAYFHSVTGDSLTNSTVHMCTVF